jgi:glutaredoxin
MITLIGNTGCSRCAMVKNILESKGIEFNYILFETLDAEIQNEVMTKAVQNQLMNFPMAFDEDKQIFNVNTLISMED